MTLDSLTTQRERARGANPPELPRPIGSSRSVLDEVLRVLDREPTHRVLDVPTGHGALVPALLERGCHVSAADICPELFRADGVECQQVNLNERLPYPPESFDAVLCCNGLHRVHALGKTLAEFTRVLRPGGRVIVSLPNYASISRRVRFMLYGSVAPSFVIHTERMDGADESVRVPVSAAQILRGLRATGFSVRQVQGLRRTPRRIRPGRLFYLPLIGMVQVVSGLTHRVQRDALELPSIHSYDMLMKDFFLIEAVRVAPQTRVVRAVEEPLVPGDADA